MTFYVCLILSNLNYNTAWWFRIIQIVETLQQNNHQNFIYHMPRIQKLFISYYLLPILSVTPKLCSISYYHPTIITRMTKSLNLNGTRELSAKIYACIQMESHFLLVNFRKRKILFSSSDRDKSWYVNTWTLVKHNIVRSFISDRFWNSMSSTRNDEKYNYRFLSKDNLK